MRKEKILERARGYWGRGKNCNKLARERVEKGLTYQYRDRKVKKREANKIWIMQTNAGSREHGLPYSKLMNGLHQGGILVNKKVLADMAKTEPLSFKALVQIAKAFNL
jgi:large subunit ribosomal protein L20